ncbi:MAG: M3 family metallopeptidase, partial [Gammaproteobacteria bacterium]|nr:M3 family metallopeptidase [Gammaproteobacteria bacterium]
MTNPLVQHDKLPQFSCVCPEHVEPALDHLLSENRREIEKLLAHENPTWESLIGPLEQLGHKLSRTWSPVGHLNAVCNDEKLREAYNRCLPKLTEYETELKQDERLYEAFLYVQKNDQRLDPMQQRSIDLSLRSFRLAGVALAAADKDQFKKLMQKLTTLQARFEENLLDATNAWTCHITNESLLAGIPQRAVTRAAAEAKKRDKTGWVFTLDYPSYNAIVGHADSTSLRKKMYTAWVTRASDQGPHAGRWDNSDIMEEILAARHEAAKLLGYSNYADYSLATKMAESVDQVGVFLRDLAQRSYDAATDEFEELEHFAGHELNAWDVAYFSEKLRREKFAISDEELRPYFPISQVMQGMFDVVQEIFGVDVREREGVDVWNADVRFFDVIGADGALHGSFYIDLYTRSAKRGGAWM